MVGLLRLIEAHPTFCLKTRKGRRDGRPLSITNSMHLVLRSSKARGPWSFKLKKNRYAIQKICQKFAHKNAVQIVSMANVGNHLHLQIQLGHRGGYKPFIRAISAAIVMTVTGVNRWTRGRIKAGKFWDHRPFTRIVMGYGAKLALQDYILINQLEGGGISRTEAELWVRGPPLLGL
ncbi:MAG: transposase [Bdellovibrionales bacterium]